jgi:ABC-type antimicrobial peptide transport system ATPase subunit
MGVDLVVGAGEVALDQEAVVLGVEDGPLVVVEHGKPRDVYANPRHERTKRFLDRIL